MAEFERSKTGPQQDQAPIVPVRVQRQVQLVVPTPAPFAPQPTPTPAEFAPDRAMQRQVAQPILQAASALQQIQVQRQAERVTLQRQIEAVQAQLPAGAEQAALQRQATRAHPVRVPAAFQRQASGQGSGIKPHIGDWTGLYAAEMSRHTPDHAGMYPAEPVKQLQRAVASGLAQSARSSSLPALQRHAELGQALAMIQRQPLGRSTVTWSLGQMLPGERPAIQRALDDANLAMQRQEEHDAKVEQLHSLQRQLEAHQAQSEQGHVMQRIKERQGSGDPLPAAVQRHMEQGLNTDLSGVRIHADDEAHQLSKKAGATAFTSGKDVYFQRSKFDPNSKSGLELLGHELTHVKQQGQGQVGGGMDPDAGLEVEAQRMGRQLADGTVQRQTADAATSAPGPAALQRQSDEHEEPQDAPLPAPLVGRSGARGRESFIRTQAERAYQAGRHAPRVNYDGPAWRSVPNSRWEGYLDHRWGDTGGGRYNDPGQRLLYVSPTAAMNNREMHEYVPPGSHPLAGSSQVELHYEARRDAQGRGGVSDVYHNLAALGLTNDALAMPKGGDGSHAGSRAVHRLLGEDAYLHSRALGQGVRDSGASGMLAPSAVGRDAYHLDVVPENTHPRQLSFVNQVGHDDLGRPITPDAATRERMAAHLEQHPPAHLANVPGPVGPGVMPEGHALPPAAHPFWNNPHYAEEAPKRTQRAGGGRYAMLGAGAMSTWNALRDGQLSAGDVAGIGVNVGLSRIDEQTMSSAWSGARRLASGAYDVARGGTPLRVAAGQLGQGALETLARPWRAAQGLPAAARSAIGGAQNLWNGVRALRPGDLGRGASALGRGTLNTLGDNWAAIRSGLSRSGTSTMEALASARGAVMNNGLRGAAAEFASAGRALPGKLFSGGRSLLARSGFGVRSGVLEAVTSGGFSAWDNAEAYQHGRVTASQATANTVVDTGVGVGAGLAGAATGAAIGSVIPVAGTAVGAVIGFGAGMLGSWAARALADRTGATDGAKRWLGGQLHNYEGSLRGTWDSLAHGRERLAQLPDQAWAGVRNGAARVATGARQAWQGAGQQLSNLAHAAQDGAGRLWTGAQTRAAHAGQALSSGAHAVQDGAQNLWRRASGGVSDTAHAVSDEARRRWQGLTHWWGA